MRFVKLIFLITVVLESILFAQPTFNIAPSYRLFPSDTVYQTEPVITVSPLNQMIMFCSAFTLDVTTLTQKSEGIYVSTNGGVNWSGNDRCNGSSTLNHGGDPGIAIDKNGVFLLYHIGYIQTGVFTNYSTNLGQNWSGQFTISQQTPPEDKGTLTTDNISSSPFYGRSYCSWVNFSPPYPVLISYTTNSGVSWSSFSQVNPSPPNRCSGGDVKTGPNGEVYDTWAGVQASTPYTELFAGFAVSTTGGASWNVTQNIFTMHGINGFLPSKGNIRVNGLPKILVDMTSGPRRGWIYIVTTEINNSPAGSDPDIVFHRSTNGGQSWSAGIRVNQDPINNGKIQYFPAMNVDSTGAINVLYYDDRNTSSDSAEVYISRSTNGGGNWYDFVVSDRRFKPKPIIQSSFYQGDFIDITSARNKLFPVWMADYTGMYQVWTTILEIDAIGVKQISSEVPKDFALRQNYPNPFNPSTNIEFSVPKSEFINLTIYNALGKEISNPVNNELNAGTYKVVFDASNLPSGVYFYKLKTNGFYSTKKMILLK